MSDAAGNPLRRERIAAGIGSAFELGTLAGVSPQTVYDIEGGKRARFGDPTIIRLAFHLPGVEADNLIAELREWYSDREPAEASA